MSQIKKTCLDCQNHTIDYGYDSSTEDPGCLDVLLCKISDDTSVWQNILELDNPATECKFFKPIIAATCGYCRKSIGIPRYRCKLQLNHWYSGTTIAVCSIECQDALDRQWMKETLYD
jgi:hypothetical protein